MSKSADECQPHFVYHTDFNPWKEQTMDMKRMAACAVLAMAVLVGCEREDATTGTGTSGTGTTATPAASETTPDTSVTPTTMPSAGTATLPDSGALTAAGQTAAESAATQPAAAGAAVTQQAQTLLDQTVTYVKENKMDLAEKSLTQLEQLKPKLPAEWHPRVDQARKAFETAKTGQGLKLDSLLPGTAK
jgi:hypothetical protein